MNLSVFRDSPERTVPDLPYPLRRIRLTTLVVIVTFGVVDTCSISTGDGWTEGTDGWTEGTGNGVRGSNHRGEFFYTTS